MVNRKRKAAQTNYNKLKEENQLRIASATSLLTGEIGPSGANNTNRVAVLDPALAPTLTVSKWYLDKSYIDDGLDLTFSTVNKGSGQG